MFSGETTKELKDTISCQNELICNLNKKLEDFNTVVLERNQLREIYKQFELNQERSDDGHRKLFNDLLISFNIQSEKLKKFVNEEYQWELKYRKLDDVNKCISNELKMIKCSESQLQRKLADTDATLKCVQQELCKTKSELEDSNNMVRKLSTHLKCNEEELCKLRRELDDSKSECNNLNETNEILNLDLKCTKKILCDTKLAATHMEKSFMLERETLSNELIISCQKINDLELKYDEATCKLNDERYNTKKLSTKLIELNKMCAKNHLEMKNRVQKLQEEICSKNNDLCCLKKVLNEFQQDNDCKCMEIQTLMIKLCERESQLKQMCLLSQKVEQIKKKLEACRCSKKTNTDCPQNKTETNTCCPKKKVETNTCCPKKKVETNTCCPKKKVETNTCCPKIKPQITTSCPQKKIETTTCCSQKKTETNTFCPKTKTETNTCCPKTKNETQKCGNKPETSTFKTEMKSLLCELENIKQSIG